MNKKGFTLIELLGVIIILGLFLLVVIPKVDYTLDESSKKSFRLEAQTILKTIELKLARQPDYNVLLLNEDNLESELGIKGDNLDALSVSYDENDFLQLVVYGKNDWQGLVAHGVQDNMIVEDISTYVP